jgi:hypothetical protein
MSAIENDVSALRAQVAQLTDERDAALSRLRDFEHRLLTLEQSVAAPRRADYSSVCRAREKVREFTKEIFSGRFDESEKEDCEVPGDFYVAFRVKDPGTMDEVLARHQAWHERLCGLPTDLRAMFRLSIDARP